MAAILVFTNDFWSFYMPCTSLQPLLVTHAKYAIENQKRQGARALSRDVRLERLVDITPSSSLVLAPF